MNFLQFKSYGFLTPKLQIILIVVLFALSLVTQYYRVLKTGKMYGHYPARISILLAPLYEELIFRGLILGTLITTYSPLVSVIITSILFGLWHLKNGFWLPKPLLLRQIIYTGVFFGPLMCVLVILSGSIWPAVILHYINNFFASFHRVNR